MCRSVENSNDLAMLLQQAPGLPGLPGPGAEPDGPQVSGQGAKCGCACGGVAQKAPGCASAGVRPEQAIDACVGGQDVPTRSAVDKLVRHRASPKRERCIAGLSGQVMACRPVAEQQVMPILRQP